jgi:hypothetical protein
MRYLCIMSKWVGYIAIFLFLSSGCQSVIHRDVRILHVTPVSSEDRYEADDGVIQATGEQPLLIRLSQPVVSSLVLPFVLSNDDPHQSIHFYCRNNTGYPRMILCIVKKSAAIIFPFHTFW